MSDSQLNQWLGEGDDAAEAAFTPDPPASPPTPEGAHLWVNKEAPTTPILKWWDGSAWVDLVDLTDPPVPASRQVIAGAGLTGGGDLSTDRTLDVGAGTGITVNANDIEVDQSALKLDDFAAPDDTTDLDATASAHGLLPKLSGNAAEFLDGTGAFSSPTVGAGGSDTELQYNNMGALDGITGATSDGTSVTLTSPTLITPALGTPASGTLSNTTGFPVANLAGLGANVATALATPSSANLAAAVTDETGSGALVFATSPTLVTPALGTPASGNLANCIGSVKVVRKTSPDSVSSDDTVNADDELFFAIAANEVWQYDVVLFVTGNETGDFKVFMDHPSGATVRVGIDAISSTVAATATAGIIVRIQTTTETGGSGFGVSNSATTTMVLLHGICVNGANAGNITVMWAQNTSNGTNTTVEANSYIRATRVA